MLSPGEKSTLQNLKWIFAVEANGDDVVFVAFESSVLDVTFRSTAKEEKKTDLAADLLSNPFWRCVQEKLDVARKAGVWTVCYWLVVVRRRCDFILFITACFKSWGNLESSFVFFAGWCDWLRPVEYASGPAHEFLLVHHVKIFKMVFLFKVSCSFSGGFLAAIPQVATGGGNGALSTSTVSS